MKVENTLTFLAWSRLFSPLVSEAQRQEAYEQLGFENFGELQPEMWSAFHVGLPQPPVSLLLHVTLGREGGPVREDLMRVVDHLALEWGVGRLPPDHLACALELLALGIEAGEPVLVDGLRARYLIPWCEEAAKRLAAFPHLLPLVTALLDDLGAAPTRRTPPYHAEA